MLVLFFVYSQIQSSLFLSSLHDILRDMKVVDPHIDIADLSRFFDFTVEDFYSSSPLIPVSFDKLLEAEVKIVGFSLYFDKSLVKTSYYDGVKEFLSFYSDLTKASDRWQMVQNSNDLINLPEDKVGYFFSIEGFDCFRTPDDFDEFYDLGVRSFGFTWSYDNQFACGQETKNDTGLSTAGKEVLARMNDREKLIVDLAHLSPKTICDLDKHWRGMLVATHCNAFSIHNNQHNLSDEQIQIIVDRGGVVSIFPIKSCTGPNGTFEELYRHIEYIASKWSIDNVGLCSDIYPLPEYPFCEGYTDISIWNGIKEYFSEKLSEAELKQVCYGNWMRVLTKALNK